MGSLGLRAPLWRPQAYLEEKVAECKMLAESEASVTTWESKGAPERNHKVYGSHKGRHFMALDRGFIYVGINAGVCIWTYAYENLHMSNHFIRLVWPLTLLPGAWGAARKKRQGSDVLLSYALQQ